MTARGTQVAFLAAIALAWSLMIFGCGGGGTAPAPGPSPPQPLRITITSPHDGITGKEYTESLTATGGKFPYSWSLTTGSGPLPPGLELSPHGAINGTPTTTGTYPFSVEVKDSAGQTATRDLKITVYDPLIITTTSLPNAIQGQVYSQGLQAMGGIPPYKWSLSTPAPPGLEFSSSGTISGTPTGSGAYNLSVQVQDSASKPHSASRELTLYIIPEVHIVTTYIERAVVGREYSSRLYAEGGTQPYTWSLASGSGPLPPGLTLSSSGVISGVPTTEGTFEFTVELQDSSPIPKTAQKTLSMSVIVVIEVPARRLPDAVRDRAYTFTFQASGGTPPYTWSWRPHPYLYPPNFPPPGLTLSTDGVLGGVPAESRWYTFGVEAQDSASHTGGTIVDLYVYDPLDITPTSLPETNVGLVYDVTLQMVGGNGVVDDWRLAPGSGPVPPGLAMRGQTTSSGRRVARITGIPTAAGVYDFVVQVSDTASPPQTAIRAYTILVGNRLKIATQELPVGVVGQAYVETIVAYGGTPPYTWALLSGGMPPGLEFNTSTVQVTGTPTEVGVRFLEVQVTDSSTPPETDTRIIPIQVRPPLAIVTGSLPDGAYYVSYQPADLGVVGGKPPLTGRIAAGSLPSGMWLNFAGPEGPFTIQGTPYAVGLFPFTFEVTDSSSPQVTVSRELSLRVNKRLAITTSSLPDGRTRDPYSATLAATGGVPPYVWSVSSLPPGLTLDPSTGQISGTPKQGFEGSLAFAVRDSGNYQQNASGTVRLRVTWRLTITTTRAPGARRGVPFQFTLGRAGGTPAFTWSVTSGSLPVGLSLNSYTGAITGTPSREETQAFTVGVTDSSQPAESDERTLSVSVVENPGRNDSIQTATPISNGTFRASISPYADPISGPANPDNDYYVLAADPGAVVTVETQAKRLLPAGPLDSVIEIVDSNGARFTTCRNEGNTDGLEAGTYDPTPSAFDDVCVNDDIDIGTVQDSKLQFQVPGTFGTPVTFYVRVLDWSGSARPDFVYDLVISGAN